MADRIYTELRLSHNSQEEKEEFERKIDEQAAKLGLKSRVDYIRHIVDVDAATKILERLKGKMEWEVTWKAPKDIDEKGDIVWEDKKMLIHDTDDGVQSFVELANRKFEDRMFGIEYHLVQK